MNPTALIALGSNLGSSKQILREAMDRLQSRARSTLHRSSFWQSTPVNCPPGSPLFVNAAVAFETLNAETPESLLASLQELEREFGRRPKRVLNEPRPLDLDLIAFGNEIRTSPQLRLPHPRAPLRRFVLEPLNEIAPGFVLPGQLFTVRELLERVQSDEQVIRL
jgi:2-amino-4-hydroxy-6-hydroxymethyldihydropteridine diphosphokinase